MSVTDLDRELLQLNQGEEGLPLTGVIRERRVFWSPPRC